VEVVGEVVILVTSILAVGLVLTYVTVTYGNYASYITAHGELANIVLEAYGYLVNGSTVIILGNLGRVNAYVAKVYALGSNSSTPISLSNVREYLSYTSPQASNPVTIDGRLLLEPGHMAIVVVKGTYWGVSVEACPTPTSNTCGWVMLKWSVSTYTPVNSTSIQGQLGSINVGSVTIEVTNDTLSIPWVVTVTINGPGGYTYSKGGSGDLTWVQTLANSLQTLDTSISLVNQSGYAGGLSIYQLGDSTYGCIAEPRGYLNVTSGVVKYTINCYRLPTSQVTIIAYYSGPGPAELTLDPTWVLVNGWNKFTLETTPGPHELSYAANGVCWFNGTLTGSSGSVEVNVPNSTYTILVSLICGESPFYVNAHVEDNLTTGSGEAHYMIYTGDANHHVFDEASGSTSQWFRLRLPGLSGYVWGVVTNGVPSQYTKCYLYNASLLGIGSTPPEYPVTNGSTISLYVHCLPGSGVVYWVVKLQGAVWDMGIVWWTLTDSYGHSVTNQISSFNPQYSGNFSVNGPDTLTLSLYVEPGFHYVCSVASQNPQTVNPGQTAVFTIDCNYVVNRPTSTTTTTTTTSTWGGYWSLYITVNDNPGVSYTITDQYGNSLSGSQSVSQVFFANYPPGTSAQLTASTVPSCTISPSSTTITPTSPNMYVTFTVSCASSTSSPAPTGSPTSTPTGTPTSTGTPTPTSTPPPTSTTPTSTTSSPPPTTVTTTGTNPPPSPPPTFTGFYEACAPGSVQPGQAEAFGCIVAWKGHTVTELVAQVGKSGNLIIETTTLYYDISNSPAGAIGAWTLAGTCPPGFVQEYNVNGGNFVAQLSGTTGTYTWYVTVSEWCYNQHIPNPSFAFFTRWNPPELPIDWLLRGGTDVESEIAPLYLKAWNEYVSMWLSENGFALDLLILLALVMPILVRPATRRLRLT